MTNVKTLDFWNKLKDYNNIFIFGCADFGKFLYEKLIAELGTDKAIRFCDNNAKSRPHPCAEVLMPEEAVRNYPDALFCIGSLNFTEEIYDQLIKMGISTDSIIKASIPEIVQEFKFTPKTYLLNIEYHLTEHCNLKCASCVQFANIAEEEFADLQTFKRDMTRFREIIQDNIKQVTLLGGEPLLHPQVEGFVEYTRELFPETDIHLVTNGILLFKMPESFWESLKRNNIILSFSEYPIKIKTEDIYKKAEKYEINLLLNTSVNSTRNDVWGKMILDLKGLQHPEESAVSCWQINANCSRLYNGRFYPCTVAGKAWHFNKKFDQNLLLTDEDSIDIYSDVSAEDIFNFIARPRPFCRYCDIKKWTSVPWKLSTFDIGEFIEI